MVVVRGEIKWENSHAIRRRPKIYIYIINDNVSTNDPNPPLVSNHAIIINTTRSGGSASKIIDTLFYITRAR